MRENSSLKARLINLAPYLLMIFGTLFLAWPALTFDMPKLVSTVNDDSFYYLKVAHNIVSGYGSSFDGINPTNGYHPLWMVISMPVYALVANLDLALRTILVYQALLIFISMALMYRWLKPVLGRSAFFAILPLAFYLRFTYLYNSVEAPVVILMITISFVLFIRLIRAGFQRVSHWLFLALGFSLGLLVLSRLDYIFFVVSALLIIAGKLLRARRINRRGIGNIILLGLPTGIFVVIDFIWNWKNFGHIITISGAMKNTFPALQPRLGYWSIAHPEYFVISLLSLGFVFLYAIRRVPQPLKIIPPESHLYSSFLDAVAWLSLGTVLHYGFVSLFGKWAVRFWYFAGYVVVLLVLTAIVVSIFRDYLGRVSKKAQYQSLFMGIVFISSLMIALASNFWAIHRRSQGIVGFQPFAYQAALWVRDNLPRNAILGMNDAGTFGYFSDRAVVNLDGVINNFEYQEYLRQGRFAQYLDDQGISYLVTNAVHDPTVLNGTYKCTNFGSFSHLYDVPGGSIKVCNEQEVFRSEVFYYYGGPAQFVIWKISSWK